MMNSFVSSLAILLNFHELLFWVCALVQWSVSTCTMGSPPQTLSCQYIQHICALNGIVNVHLYCYNRNNTCSIYFPICCCWYHDFSRQHSKNAWNDCMINPLNQLIFYYLAIPFNSIYLVVKWTQIFTFTPAAASHAWIQI